ncbi:hypothetical protein SCG7109_BP_00050 [Chlamydiales bacterium SCGC AG-110-M15]|nr:hypothetical protein SCG7109_BP_00050 [Chlamydiales bacterium SCGC AG-110-M15]
MYDFIASQIDDENDSYASELLDGFSEFIADPVWFDFLRIRIQAMNNSKEAQDALEELLDEVDEQKDLDLYLEVLQFVAHHCDFHILARVAKNTIQEIETVEDFNDFVKLCSDYFQQRDYEEEAECFHALVKPSENPEDECISKEDRTAVLKELTKQEQLISGN